jgi:hypothetical protein
VGKDGEDITVGRANSQCSIDGSGAPSITISASLGTGVGAGAGDTNKGKGAEGSVGAGTRANYGVTTDPTTGHQIENGDRPPPNPRDPSSIPPGSSITLDHDFYVGADGKVAYDHIAVELGYEKGHRVSSAVQRVDGDHVRVTVGDSDFVDNTIGVSVGGHLGYRWGNGFDDGKARSVDIDISTPEGRAAYGDFIEHGQLPGAGAAGTSDPTTSVSTTSTSHNQVDVDLGPLDVSHGDSSVEWQYVETTHADGSVDRDILERMPDMALSTHQDVAGGKVTGQSIAVQLHDVAGDTVQGFQQLVGGRGDTGGDRDIALTFSGDDAANLQNAALDQVLAAQRGHDGSPFADGGTRAQLKAYLATHHNGEGLYDHGMPLPLLAAVAGAQTPADVIRALMVAAHGSPEGLLDTLSRFILATNGARHALGDPDMSSPFTGGYANRPPAC